MLQTVADLLHELQERERAALLAHGDVGHQGMIGDMYEGLTRELLSRALFGGMDLRVVTGKVRMDDGTYSSQIDAMIVRGEGEQMPFSGHYLYPPDQVVAAVEVKKTLYGEALDEAYANLRSLYHRSYLQRIPARQLFFVYRKVAQSELPVDGDLTRLSWKKEMMAHVLMWDVAMPVRIVFGYDGYKSEETLRKGLVNYLERVFQGGLGGEFGPAGFPSLVICGSNSLVKLNGMPFSAQAHDASEWPLYASYDRRPAHLMLEVIWTRLLSMGLIDMDVFGDDMEVEQLRPLLYAKPVERGGRRGWHYRYELFDRKEAISLAAISSWEPLKLSDKEAVLVTHLCRVMSIDTRTSEFWSAWVADMQGDVDDTLRRLRFAGIAAVDSEGVLRLLTELCQVVIVPNVGWVAGENSTGRLTRWVVDAGKTRARESSSD